MDNINDDTVDIKRLVDLLMDPNPEIQQEAMELVHGLEKFQLPDTLPIPMFNIGMEQQTSYLDNVINYIDRLIKFLVDLSLQITNTNVWLEKTLNDVKTNYHNKRDINPNGKVLITKNLKYVTLNYKSQLDFIQYHTSIRQFKNVFNELVSYQATQFNTGMKELIDAMRSNVNDSTIVSVIEHNSLGNYLEQIDNIPKYLLGNYELVINHGRYSDVKLVDLDQVGKKIPFEYEAVPYTHRQVVELTREAQYVVDLLKESTNAFKVRRIKERLESIKDELKKYSTNNQDTTIATMIERYIYWNIAPINEFQKAGSKIVKALCSTIRDMT